MSAAFKTSRWVGVRPLKQISEVDQSGVANPLQHIAKIYESLEVVLESLWTHNLKFEVAELGTLILSDEDGLMANMLEQRTHGFFSGKDATQDFNRYVANGILKPYPGHGAICLLLMARAKTNQEMMNAADLCESISECLRLIQSHLNQGHSETRSEKLVIARLVKCWKQTFPYSE